MSPSKRVNAPALTRSAGKAMDVSQHLTGMADGMSLAAGAFPRTAPSWEGSAERAVAQLMAVQPQRLDRVAQAMRAAASILTDYADTLLVAAQLAQDAEFPPDVLARELDDRAQLIAAQGAIEASERLLTLARSAPARPGAAARMAERVRGWQAEGWLKEGEAGEIAVSLTTDLVGWVRHRLW